MICNILGVPAVASGIMVSEGGLLKPEMLHSGIVFSVMKKKGLTTAHMNYDSDQYHSSSQNAVVESLQLDCLGMEIGML
ncbi:hypothetical protein MRB53_008014 [Persea americana]|uniref:Uncharacterized protein n=1 Tax=Persea americana TaxID=3435 RepID=A0ACC2MLH2_PERAE|nr:hypothetical protein MRB53_008014 [Persea americana]